LPKRALGGAQPLGANGRLIYSVRNWVRFLTDDGRKIRKRRNRLGEFVRLCGLFSCKGHSPWYYGIVLRLAETKTTLHRSAPQCGGPTSPIFTTDRLEASRLDSPSDDAQQPGERLP